MNDSYTWTPGIAVIVTCLLLRRNLRTLGWSLGEEIGWRGLLVPDLYRLTSNFAATCMIGGLVWAAWHYPELIYLYRSGRRTAITLWARR